MPRGLDGLPMRPLREGVVPSHGHQLVRQVRHDQLGGRRGAAAAHLSRGGGGAHRGAPLTQTRAGVDEGLVGVVSNFTRF